VWGVDCQCNGQSHIEVEGVVGRSEGMSGVSGKGVHTVYMTREIYFATRMHSMFRRIMLPGKRVVTAFRRSSPHLSCPRVHVKYRLGERRPLAARIHG
jgi:hypothetical protein